MEPYQSIIDNMVHNKIQHTQPKAASPSTKSLLSPAAGAGPKLDRPDPYVYNKMSAWNYDMIIGSGRRQSIDSIPSHNGARLSRVHISDSQWRLWLKFQFGSPHFPASDKMPFNWPASLSSKFDFVSIYPREIR
jgi:hypothetical protein